MADNDPNNQTPPTPPALATIIPEEFRDKPYLSDLKDLPAGPDGYKALFKKLDGAQTLIGKKTGIPAADASPEEWEKFHAALRPAKAEDYEFKGSDEETAKAIRGIFYEAGLSKAQAAKLSAKFDAWVEEKTKPEREAAAKLDAEFEDMTKKAFGPENVKVLERSKELLTQLTPDTMKPFLNRLPNEALVVLAGVMESVRAKFMSEDNVNGKGGAPAGANDVATLREEAQKLQASEAWKNPFDKAHEKTKARVSEIYTLIGQMTKK